jgi:hypothetical protein
MFTILGSLTGLTSNNDDDDDDDDDDDNDDGTKKESSYEPTPKKHKSTVIGRVVCLSSIVRYVSI